MNGINVSKVNHYVAVEALRQAGTKVDLYVKHQQSNFIKLLDVELIKDSKYFGFSVVGGSGTQQIFRNCTGIYVSEVHLFCVFVHVTKPISFNIFQIMEGGVVDKDGRISVGDRLVAIRNINGGVGGDFLLDNCTHEEAVNVLKKQQGKVALLVAKGETLISYYLKNNTRVRCTRSHRARKCTLL